MLLRRITKHVQDQNWFAVGIDFFIVVIGVFIGLQVSNWNEAREQRFSETEYLERLYSDTVELTDRRAHYDRSRPSNVIALELMTDFANGDTEDLSKLKNFFLDDLNTDFAQWSQDVIAAGVSVEVVADSHTCNLLDWSSSLTIPPSELPTASELTSSGNLERISSEKVKGALLSYMQEANRAEKFIPIVQKKATDLADNFPELFEIRYLKGVNLAFDEGESFPHYKCDFDSMRENKAFLNALNRNRSFYAEYTNRAVLPASERLAELQSVIEDALGIPHASEAFVTQ